MLGLRPPRAPQGRSGRLTVSVWNKSPGMYKKDPKNCRPNPSCQDPFRPPWNTVRLSGDLGPKRSQRQGISGCFDIERRLARCCCCDDGYKTTSSGNESFSHQLRSGSRGLRRSSGSCSLSTLTTTASALTTAQASQLLPLLLSPAAWNPSSLLPLQLCSFLPQALCSTYNKLLGDPTVKLLLFP